MSRCAPSRPRDAQGCANRYRREKCPNSFHSVFSTSDRITTVEEFQRAITNYGDRITVTVHLIEVRHLLEKILRLTARTGGHSK
jgi:hypothetical protein